jgi:hypothetical protein
MQRPPDRIMRRSGCQEIAGDQLRALVDELVERVLAVRARCAPDDGLQKQRVCQLGEQ